jgi:hypothetical protein
VIVLFLMAVWNTLPLAWISQTRAGQGGKHGRQRAF